MNLHRLIALTGLMASLAACAAPDVASRSTQAPALLDTAATEAPAPTLRHDVRAVHVTVPRDLRVSEANVYYPLADIVWRGEARGDRHAQVEAILQEAFARGTEGMDKGAPVIVEAELTRFHALTEKTRYSFGGVHAIRFRLTLRDALTGEVMGAPQMVAADIKAAGGQRALEEESRGLTQRVVIVNELSQAIRAALSRPPAAAPRHAPDGAAAPALTSRLNDDLRLTLAAVSMKNMQVAPGAE